MNSSQAQNRTNGLEIAVIGMAGRFPGARNVPEYWENLCNGVETITFFSDDELAAAGVDTATLRDPLYIKAAGMVDGIEWFDAEFFEISPREAEITDPQQRLFLECAWEALEDAGYDPGRNSRVIGVYGGAGCNSYMFNLLSNGADSVKAVGAYQLRIANNVDYLTTRVSYKLNLRGPSVTVQTACSTSLVAVHLACQGLLNGDCDMALAGGVSLAPLQKRGYFYQEGGIASIDGKCRPFDAAASGTVGGSGAGIVVLKRLADALADADNIYAVIKGSAINNDGSAKVGYTAPSVDGQADLIKKTQILAQVGPETITYVEAHGTGTVLGDPIEFAALKEAFRAGTDKSGFCALGSVKSNIGHLDAAAGIAGLIKAVLAVKHGLVPPSLNCSEPNPQLDLPNSPFYINTALASWQGNGFPRRAGVSSFGIGGTNAHVIVEESAQAETGPSSRAAHLLTLSARTEQALESATERLGKHLQWHPHLRLEDVAFTLQMGRRAFSHRRFVLCSGLGDAVEALRAVDNPRTWTGQADGSDRKVAFMFSGQGTQRLGMGRELYRIEPCFRSWVDRAAAALDSTSASELMALLGQEKRREQWLREDQADWLDQTRVAQPVLFIVEYALVRWLMDLGVKPAAMIGHSLGEFVAACVAGVFTLEEGLRLVVERGRLMQQTPKGAMLALQLGEEEVTRWLCPGLWLSSVNGARQCVVSGTLSAIGGLERAAMAKGVPCQRLRTQRAFHSGLMDAILEPFNRVLRGVKLRTPALPYVSNVTGDWIREDEATDIGYWLRHVTEPVRFAKGIKTIVQEHNPVLVEIGPGTTLCRLAKLEAQHSVVLPTIGSPDKESETPFEASHFYQTLGQLWLCGVDIDWNASYQGETRRRVSLPTYPFQRERYWIERQPVDRKAASKRIEQRSNPAAGGSEAPSETVAPSTYHHRPVLSRPYEPPADDMEEQLVMIWEEILGVESIGGNDSFFELGGHSLLATQVLSRIRSRFGMEVPLRSLFIEPTVKGMAAVIRAQTEFGAADEFHKVERAVRETDLPLSFAQQRLWFIHQLEPHSSAYNMPMAVRLRGPLSIPALSQSLWEVTRRHEVLRTRLVTKEGRPIQVVDDLPDFDLPELELRSRELTHIEDLARRMAAEHADRPFAIDKSPLWRAAVARLGEEDHVLLVNMDHLVGDLWSLGILVRELTELYQQYGEGHKAELPELPVQYADYAIWQRQWLQSDVLADQVTYWRRQLAGAPVLKLPTEPSSFALTDDSRENVPFRIPPELTADLQALSLREEVTLFMTLLAAFQVVLGRSSGQDDFVIGTSVANRNRLETEGLIGFFVNQLVLRADLSGNPSFRELLRRASETTLGAYAHQDIPFEKLVEEISPSRDLSRTPLFQVKLVLQNTPHERAMSQSALLLESFFNPVLEARFGLMLMIWERKDALTGSFSYGPNFVSKDCVESIGRELLELLRIVATDCEPSISSLSKTLDQSAESYRESRMESLKEDFEASLSRRVLPHQSYI
jgi:acyl transferase domain-containing protein/acyl carrier protein